MGRKDYQLALAAFKVGDGVGTGHLFQMAEAYRQLLRCASGARPDANVPWREFTQGPLILLKTSANTQFQNPPHSWGLLKEKGNLEQAA